MYAILEQEKLTQKIVEVEQAHENQGYGLSWQLINDISGRKSSQSAKIQGESAEKSTRSTRRYLVLTFQKLAG